jgi:hypothetical protein
MALKAERICFLGAKQVIVLAAVRFVTGRASLLESRLVQVCFFELVGLIAVASEARAHRVRLQEAGTLAGMWIVAGDAFSLGSGMRHLGLVNLLDLIAMTGRAECSRIGIRQNHFAIFRRRVADLASPVGKGRMRELLHQLRLRRLMGIVALGTSSRAKGLPLVRLD